MSNEIFEEFGADPVALLRAWMEEATAHEPNDPEAACLATSNKDGQPSARMVLIKAINEKGLKFHTNEDSRKGHDLAENPQAALCFYWKSIRKQIRIEGLVEQAPASEADDYFKTRSIERQIGAWASKQSSPFEKRTDMEAAVEKYRAEFSGTDHIPRPPYWKAYILKPQSIEFWIADEHRLHTRFVYTRDGANWTAHWLCP